MATKEAKADKVLFKMLGRLKSSAVEESDKGKSIIVTTKFSGLAIPGIFEKLNKELEKVAFGNAPWRSLQTNRMMGIWNANISRRNDDKFVSVTVIKNCSVKNISITRANDITVVGLSLIHEVAQGQSDIEKLVCSEVEVELSPSEEIPIGKIPAGAVVPEPEDDIPEE